MSQSGVLQWVRRKSSEGGLDRSRAALATCAALFFLYVPTNLLSSIDHSGILKRAVWCALLAAAIVMTVFDRRFQRFLHRSKVGLLLGASVLYFGVHALLMPPAFGPMPPIALIVLLPVMTVLGIGSSFSKGAVAWVLFAMSGSIVAIGLFTMSTTGLLTDPGSGFILYFPGFWPSDVRWYQTVALFCGMYSLLAVFFVMPRMTSRSLMALFVLSAGFAAMFIGELGARTALISTTLAFVALAVLKCLRGRRGGSSGSDVGVSNAIWCLASLTVISALWVPSVLGFSMASGEGTLIQRRSSLTYEGYASLLESKDPEQDSDRILSQAPRLAILTAATDHFRSKEWNLMFGSGAESFQAAGIGRGWHPHCIPLELLLEYGIVGLCMVLSLLAALARGVVRQIHSPGRDDLRNGDAVLGVVVMFSVASLFTGSVGTSMATLVFLYGLVGSSDVDPTSSEHDEEAARGAGEEESSACVA